MGSLDSVATDHRLAASSLLILLLMPADCAIHRWKDQLSGRDILGRVPPDDEAKVGATIVRLLVKATFGAWSFASLAPDALPRGAWDGILR